MSLAVKVTSLSEFSIRVYKHEVKYALYSKELLTFL
jgi:hypothetical protein